MQPKRWIIERTFGWLMQARRLARDDETKTSSSQAMILVHASRIMLRRIAKLLLTQSLSHRQQAAQGGRTVLRPTPQSPSWPYVFSLGTTRKVGPDGRVPVGILRLRIAAPPDTRLVHCQDPNVDLSVLRYPPTPNFKPQLLLHLPA